MIIHDSTDNDLLYPSGFGRGYVERDYDEYPEEMYAPPSESELIPESEWDARYEEQEAEESSLEHLYLRGGKPAFVNLDQGSEGFCWGYSVGHTTLFDRLSSNQPHVRINPHAVCSIIKNGKNEGGWCGLSQELYKSMGCPIEGTGPGQWPLHSRDLRYDTPQMREQAKLHCCVEDWVDLTRRVYDRNLTIRQLATYLLSNRPCAVDFNWWGHSVCAIRWVRIERGSWGPLIINSWRGWGRHGLAQLSGQKGVPNGAVCIRSTTASAA